MPDRISQHGGRSPVFKVDGLSAGGLIRAGAQRQVKVAVEKLVFLPSLLRA